MDKDNRQGSVNASTVTPIQSSGGPVGAAPAPSSATSSSPTSTTPPAAVAGPASKDPTSNKIKIPLKPASTSTSTATSTATSTSTSANTAEKTQNNRMDVDPIVLSSTPSSPIVVATPGTSTSTSTSLPNPSQSAVLNRPTATAAPAATASKPTNTSATIPTVRPTVTTASTLKTNKTNVNTNTQPPNGNKSSPTLPVAPIPNEEPYRICIDAEEVVFRPTGYVLEGHDRRKVRSREALFALTKVLWEHEFKKPALKKEMMEVFEGQVTIITKPADLETGLSAFSFVQAAGSTGGNIVTSWEELIEALHTYNLLDAIELPPFQAPQRERLASSGRAMRKRSAPSTSQSQTSSSSAPAPKRVKAAPAKQLNGVQGTENPVTKTRSPLVPATSIIAVPAAPTNASVQNSSTSSGNTTRPPAPTQRPVPQVGRFSFPGPSPQICTPSSPDVVEVVQPQTLQQRLPQQSQVLTAPQQRQLPAQKTSQKLQQQQRAPQQQLPRTIRRVTTTAPPASSAAPPNNRPQQQQSQPPTRQSAPVPVSATRPPTNSSISPQRIIASPAGASRLSRHPQQLSNPASAPTATLTPTSSAATTVLQEDAFTRIVRDQYRRIFELESALETSKAEVASLTGEKVNLNARIELLQAQLAAAEEKAESYKERNESATNGGGVSAELLNQLESRMTSSFENRISSLRQELGTSIEGKVTKAMKARLASLETLIGEVTTSQEELNAKLREQVEKKLSDLGTYTAKQRKILDKKIDGVYKEVKTLATSPVPSSAPTMAMSVTSASFPTLQHPNQSAPVPTTHTLSHPSDNRRPSTTLSHSLPALISVASQLATTGQPVSSYPQQPPAPAWSYGGHQ